MAAMTGCGAEDEDGVEDAAAAADADADAAGGAIEATRRVARRAGRAGRTTIRLVLDEADGIAGRARAGVEAVVVPGGRVEKKRQEGGRG
jgi:hypothetical protein